MLVRCQHSRSPFAPSSGSDTGLILLYRSKRGVALFHVKQIPKPWRGCVAERLLRVRLSARYRTEHGDDDHETGLGFHDGRSFRGEGTYGGHPLDARTARWVTSWISPWFVIHWAMPPGFVSFVERPVSPRWANPHSRGFTWNQICSPVDNSHRHRFMSESLTRW